MASDDRKLTVTILGNASGAKKALGEVDSKAEESGSRIKKIGESIAGAFVLGEVAHKVVDFAKEAIEIAEKQEKIAHQTEAVLKSTGDASGQTAEGIDELTTSLSNQTGINHQIIEQGTNMLLTFTNLKNGVGKGNDVFNQANKTLLDMSVALGEDPKKAAIQLGKALNDPVKGITALQRVGVTFTASQKAQIAAMVKSGNTMGAQKKILAELNREFGGSAAAQSTPLEKLKNTWTNLKEEIGAKLLPVISKLADWLATKLPQAIIIAQNIFHTVQPYLTAFKQVITDVLGFIQQHAGTVQFLATVVGAAAGAFVVWQLAIDAWTAVTKVAAAVQTAFNAVMDANPVMLVVIAIAALAAGVIYAYTHFKTFHDVVDAIGTFFSTVFVDSLHGVQTAVKDVIEWVKHNWPLLLGILTGPLGLAIAEIIKHWDTIRAFVEGLPAKFAKAGEKIWSWITDAFSTVWGDLKTSWTNAVTFVEGIPARIKAAGSTMWGWITDAFHLEWDGLKTSWDTAIGYVAALPGRVTSATAGLWDGIKDSFRAAINWVIGKWNGLQFSIPGVDTHIPGVGKIGGFTLGTPDIPYLAKGGIVTKPTLAMIGEAGDEAVIPLTGARGRNTLGQMGGGDTYVINLTVQGSVVTQREITKAIREDLVLMARQNGKASPF